MIRALSWAFNYISLSVNFMAQVSLLDLFVKHNYRWSYMMIRSSVLVERWTLTPHKCPRRSLFSHPLTPMLWPLTPAWVHCEYAMWLRLKKKKKRAYIDPWIGVIFSHKLMMGQELISKLKINEHWSFCGASARLPAVCLVLSTS